jgi:hypothetical protein
MKLGTENRKSVYALGVIGAFAAYMVYANFFSGPSYKTVTPPPTRSDSSDAAATAPEKSSGPDISQAKGKVSRASSSKSKNGEFHPVYISKKKEDRVDVSSVDPTIRFDLLERAMKVPPAGGERDLFQILKSPPVKQVASLNGPETIVHPFVPYGPHLPPPPPPKPGPAPPAPPTPIPFKYYGICTVHPDGTHTAYFILPGATTETDEILSANEGTILKGRYRIVQIFPDRVVVEDTQDKRRQPVTIEKENTQ